MAAGKSRPNDISLFTERLRNEGKTLGESKSHLSNAGIVLELGHLNADIKVPSKKELLWKPALQSRGTFTLHCCFYQQLSESGTPIRVKIHFTRQRIFPCIH